MRTAEFNRIVNDAPDMRPHFIVSYDMSAWGYYFPRDTEFYADNNDLVAITRLLKGKYRGEYRGKYRLNWIPAIHVPKKHLKFVGLKDIRKYSAK